MDNGQQSSTYFVSAVTFELYTEAEISKLSIQKIDNAISYDALQNEVKGGLSDPDLGAQQKSSCGKCGLPFSCLRGAQNCMMCFGHFGHIQLPLPVFNPLTFRTMFQWLNYSCLRCQRLVKLRSQATLFLKQMEALDHGLVAIVGELQLLYFEMLEEGNEAIDNALHYELERRMDDCIKNAIKESSLVSQDKNSCSRNVMAYRQKLCKAFLEKKPKKCPYCDHIRIPFRHESMAKLFVGRMSRSQREQQKRQKPPPSKRRKIDAEGEDEMKKTTDADHEGSGEKLMNQSKVKNLLRQIWSNDKDVLSRLFGSFMSSAVRTEWPTDSFFIEKLLVPPTRIRPAAKMKATIVENPQTMNLKHVLVASQHLRTNIEKYRVQKAVESAITQILPDSQNNDGSSSVADILLHWNSLQIRVNACYDKKLAKIFKDSADGMKQVFERKEGIMRMNMMGKRVNCAARSVISPDPCLDTNEVGLSQIFAKRLQFPEAVNEKNVAELRQMVINGPNKYPGAVSIRNDDGSLISLQLMSDAKRKALAKQLLTPAPGSKYLSNKAVYRHVKDGDMMILNRQPTLHRPSMQAFKAKILPSQNTIRINYSACKAFNADFDGDEMNCHMPQDYKSQAEGDAIVMTDHQYLVPKDGSPISGLIQDHMIGGVLLTIRGQFFRKDDYHKLVMAGLKDFRGRLKLLPPCILKPVCLWSGKQVVSTILLNVIPKTRKPLKMFGKAKVSDQEWVNDMKKHSKSKSVQDKYEFMSESEVIIRDSELLVGVLDKNAYGATTYGLVHCYHELYGPEVAGKLLTYLARLFIAFLHYASSFTMDIGDVLTKKVCLMHKASTNGTAKPSYNQGQRHWFKERMRCRNDSTEIFQRALNLPNATEEDISEYIENAQFSSDPDEISGIDAGVKSQLSSYQDAIKNACWPVNLWKRFPRNGLHLMVASGAKGSLVNCTQMACLLGQVDLESGRPPMQISGATLPECKPYAASPHAGGFIDHRILSSYNIRDYIFHSMAGREGLVDTAVKTSRSGYLQRCLVKHLEAVKVGYDQTVRDGDGTILQFLYGEDGIDVTKASYMKEKLFPFLVENKLVYMSQDVVQRNLQAIEKHNKSLKKWEKKFGERGAVARVSPFLNFCRRRWASIIDDINVGMAGGATQNMETDSGTDNHAAVVEQKCKEKLIEEWKSLPNEKIISYVEKTRPRPNPVTAQFMPTNSFGAISEKLQKTVDSYISSKLKHILSTVGGKLTAGSLSEREFQNLIYQKYQSSLASPGECAGILAATSIGEQTTQMTLNTFHFAGHGAMNVTLGIPRLREILMTASSNIKTPLMMVPLCDLDQETEEEVQKLVLQFRRVPLSEVVDDIEVLDVYEETGPNSRRIQHKVTLRLVDRKCLKREFQLGKKLILNVIEERFSKRLEVAITKFIKGISRQTIFAEGDKRQFKRSNNDDEGNDDKDDDNEQDDVGGRKSNAKDDDDSSSSEEEDEEKKSKEPESDSSEEESDNEDTQKTKEEEDNQDSASDSDENGERKVKKRKKGGDDEDEAEEMDLEKIIDGDGMLAAEGIKLPMENKPATGESDNTGKFTFMRHAKYASDYYRGPRDKSCHFTLEISSYNITVDVGLIVAKELAHTFIILANTTHIRNCIEKEIEESDSPPWMLDGRQGKDGKKPRKLQFEGVDFHAIYKLQHLVDINDIYSNDIHAMARTYGIEAARVVLINEIRNVFRAYGIEVDYRHLSLIADYMTASGSYEPLNRRGIDSNPSSIQKATFEMATNYLKNSLIEGVSDNVEPPSSRLFVGRPIACGTGSFEICVATT